MMLLYMKVDFIPAEIIDAFYWPLLFVLDHCPMFDASYTEITYFWWTVDWLVASALRAGTNRMRLSELRDGGAAGLL